MPIASKGTPKQQKRHECAPESGKTEQAWLKQLRKSQERRIAADSSEDSEA